MKKSKLRTRVKLVNQGNSSLRNEPDGQLMMGSGTGDAV